MRLRFLLHFAQRSPPDRLQLYPPSRSADAVVIIGIAEITPGHGHSHVHNVTKRSSVASAGIVVASSLRMQIVATARSVRLGLHITSATAF
jgi:hypothetical protein